MKLIRLKVFQSVKVGTKEHTFLTDSDFDMKLKDNLVFITRKSDGTNVVTPITNTPWFVVDNEAAVATPKPASKPARKKKKALG